MKVKSEREVTQSCLTLSDPMDYSPPGSSAHEIFQARVLEWSAIAFSDGKGQWFVNLASGKLCKSAVLKLISVKSESRGRGGRSQHILKTCR